MIEDIRSVATHWRLVHLVGISALRDRYARSRLGQFWLTISNLLLITCAGLVWSLIWRTDITKYLPYVAAGQIFYQFAAGTVNESASTLAADTRIYINERVPFFMSTVAHLYRQLIVLTHNIPIIIVVLIWSRAVVPSITLLIIPYIVITLIFITFASYTLSLICARFRDLIQVVGAVMQVMFLLTPVMWEARLLPPRYQDYLFALNPFAAILELLRNPIIGQPTSPVAFMSIVVWAVIALIAASLAHRVWGRSIIFWL